MLSVKDLDPKKLHLSADTSELLSQLPLDKVVLDIRWGTFPSTDIVRIIDPCEGFHYLRMEPVVEQLGKEMYQEMERLDMFRHDLDALMPSARVVALLNMIRQGKPGKRFFYEESQFLKRLIRKLDNKAYENWQGFSDSTIEEFLDRIREELTEIEYQVVISSFGLDGNPCATLCELTNRFMWQTESAPRYQIQKATRKLSRILGQLELIAKLPTKNRNT